MSDLAPDNSAIPQLKTRRRRSDRPERITIGGKVMVRNDIAANEQGATERTINRDDARGAAYVYIAGVKYRPEEEYHQFLLRKIQCRNQPPQRGHGRR
jgi:hypothetical protein